MTKPQALTQVTLVVLAIAAGWLFSRFLLYPWLGVPVYAPMILRPILGFVIALVLVRVAAGDNWHAMGLRRPDAWWRVIIIAALLYALLWLHANYALPWLAARIPPSPGASIMGYVAGNTVAFAGWLLIAWVVGGFIEELLFRGFLMNRLWRLFGATTLAWIPALLLQAVLFGLLHYNRGLFAFIFTATGALIFGLVYLLAKRNLWPLIIAHGAWNTIAIWGVYRSA